MAQTITQSTAVRDGSVSVTLSGAQAANNISLSGVQDEKLVILVQNINDAVAVETATITVSPGGGWRKDLGTLTVNVADNGAVHQIGPLDSARFKNTSGYVVVNVALTQGGTVSSVKLAAIAMP